LRRSAFLALLTFAAVASRCRPVAGPPCERSFSLQGSSPRIVHTASEVNVPLTLTNTGARDWVPGRVHLSYHWLWPIPRELLSPSRNVPYQDGIRTDLDEVVAPGAHVAVAGRILPPSFPGVYWLQWDMVEEGVSWFSQVSPRQQRRLVVVLPAVVAVLAPLPLMLALGGLYAIGRVERRRRVSRGLVAFAILADVVWAASSLFVKPLLLADQALLEPTRVAYWLTVVAAAAPPIVLMLLLERRARAWPLFAVTAVLALLLLGDVVYYRFFDDVLSVPAMLAIHQTWRVRGTVRSLLSARMAWLIVDLPVAVWLIVRLRRTWAFEWQRSSRPWPAAVCAVSALAVAGFAVSAPRVLTAEQLDQVFRGRAVMEQLGPIGFHLHDLWNYARSTVLRRQATPSDIKLALAWFAGRARLRSAGSSAYFGAARGKSLLVIQVESLQDFAVDYRVGGQDVMPHLRRWSEDALRFTQVTDQTSEGRSSDAEFTMMASLLPLDHGAVTFQHPANHYAALPRVLTEHGYHTMSAVAFEPGFWNRAVAHAAYGFQQSYFEPDFELTEQIGWGLNDRDFLMQMAPRVEALARPFCAWLITLSLHHPFDDFPDRHKELKLGALENTSFGNYLHTMHFFDGALEEFRTELARAGLLDETIMVVFGDHDAGFARDPDLARMIGIRPDQASWLLADRIPLFIRLPGAGDAGATDSRLLAAPAGQTDFPPTMLALLGIDPAPLPYMGRNLLGQPDDPPVLRPYGDWIDRAHLMIASGGRDRSCYEMAGRMFTDARACRDASAQARTAREVSRLVITEDLQEPFRSQLAADSP
jgi:lipoteichoic acid synthase